MARNQRAARDAPDYLSLNVSLPPLTSESKWSMWYLQLELIATMIGFPHLLQQPPVQRQEEQADAYLLLLIAKSYDKLHHLTSDTPQKNVYTLTRMIHRQLFLEKEDFHLGY